MHEKLGKRLLLENVQTGWTLANDPIVFTPPIWNGLQFGPDSFEIYPTCTINGNFSYGKYFSRALDDTLTDEDNVQRQYREIIHTCNRCGVNIVRLDNFLKFMYYFDINIFNIKSTYD